MVLSAEALDSCDSMTAIKHDYAEVWYDRRVALGFLGREDEAAVSHGRAAAIRLGTAAKAGFGDNRTNNSCNMS